MMRTLRASLALFRIRAVEGLQYRLAALSGTTVSAFWGLIEVVVLTVFYKYGHNSADSINGLSLAQGVSYIWISQFMVMMQFGAVDNDLLSKIVSGDIGVELLRPLDLYAHWFARSAAGKVNALLLRGGGILVVGILFTLCGAPDIGLRLPASGAHFALFVLSVCGAFLFSAAFTMFMTAIRVGIKWGDGPIHLISALGMILSGSHLPLQLWPDSMQTFLRLQPFAAYLDAPARLYVGSATLFEGAVSLGFQLLWVSALIIAGKLIMNKKLKTVVVQGG